HHEVGSGGQQEINYRFNTLLHAADDIQSFKYIVKNTAVKNGKTATFMPKPLAGDTVRVCTRTSRCVRTARRCSTMRPATVACPISRAITSAASCTTRLPFWRLPTRR